MYTGSGVAGVPAVARMSSEFSLPGRREREREVSGGKWRVEGQRAKKKCKWGDDLEISTEGGGNLRH